MTGVQTCALPISLPSDGKHQKGCRIRRSVPGLSHFRTTRVGKSLIKFSKMRLYICVAVSPLVNLAGGGQGLIGARRKTVMDKEFRKLAVLERRPILAA